MYSLSLCVLCIHGLQLAAVIKDKETQKFQFEWGGGSFMGLPVFYRYALVRG